ncbi:hypothetical protein LGH83_12335 [Lichenihabitans sp. PAMC28606]|uniref:hypothetical protein n=1 Tax=Lichenihabitans sp. PAMC28606 TaxID=2880932 RepID=UPI001D0B73B4|nr:hypothetical protein [Lichenihabitans sp. PAMC28606]UDL93373.1 hypothetical protein LGH83_12335 [Lichenihabitans sp. PAMC28606]
MAKLHANPMLRHQGSRPVKRSAVISVATLVLVGWTVPAALAQQANDPEAGYATRPFTPPNFKMPEGAGCAGDIARWRAVQDNDFASGNIEPKVYNQIKGEIAKAESACSAGHDGQASGMVAASKRRHGYPG